MATQMLSRFGDPFEDTGEDAGPAVSRFGDPFEDAVQTATEGIEKQSSLTRAAKDIGVGFLKAPSIFANSLY